MSARADHEGAPTDDDAEGASWAASPAVRRNMQANRGRDTAPEMAVRRALHARGLRFRVQYRLPYLRRRSVDIAFTRVKLAIFIDGCFWHQCQTHYVAPKSNAEFWIAKVARNRLRDRETDNILIGNGWLVLRFWEHEEPKNIVNQIGSSYLARRYLTTQSGRHERMPLRPDSIRGDATKIPGEFPSRLERLGT